MNLIIAILMIFTASSCIDGTVEKWRKDGEAVEKLDRRKIGKLHKVIFIDSYNEDYEWSRHVEAGIRAYYAHQEMDVYLKVFHLDTKRYKTEAYKKNVGMKAHKIIDAWKPDMVIACDDNASKYLIVPYFMDSDLPFIFCGVNWDASVYGFPTKNITGVLEIAPALETLAILKRMTKGGRIGYIGGNTITEIKELEGYKKVLGIDFTDGALVKDFSEWQREYIRLQKAVDILVWVSPFGITNWSHEDAMRIIRKHTKIPTGSNAEYSAPYVLVSYAKSGREQGWLAAELSEKILTGQPPSSIPVIKNKQFRLYVNRKLADELGINIPKDVLKRGVFIE